MSSTEYTANAAQAPSLLKRLNPVRYRLEFGWDVRLAHRATQREDGRVACSCLRGVDCPAAGKHPTRAWRSERGRTLPNPRALAHEWRAHPWNVAVLTGQRSGVVVADIDPRHGGSLEALWVLGWPQRTPVEQTGGGGWHVYVACPSDGLPSVDGYAPGIEVKADVKLVIAAPSVYWNGARYAWLDGQSPWEVPLATLSDEIVRGLRRATRASSARGEALPAVDVERLRGLAPRLVQRAVERARAGSDGGRHNTGVWLACQLRDLRLSGEDGALLMLAYQREVEALV